MPLMVYPEVLFHPFFSIKAQGWRAWLGCCRLQLHDCMALTGTSSVQQRVLWDSALTSVTRACRAWLACKATGCSLPTRTLPMLMVLVGRRAVWYTCSQYLQTADLRT